MATSGDIELAVDTLARCRSFYLDDAAFERCLRLARARRAAALRTGAVTDYRRRGRGELTEGTTYHPMATSYRQRRRPRSTLTASNQLVLPFEDVPD